MSLDDEIQAGISRAKDLKDLGMDLKHKNKKENLFIFYKRKKKQSHKGWNVSYSRGRAFLGFGVLEGCWDWVTPHCPSQKRGGAQL